MEKLLELLDEYEKEIKSSYYWGISYGKLRCSVGGTDHDLYDDEIAMVIKSEEYGFIKRLVENEKIDKSKVFSFIDTADKPYEDILCLLVLSDEPIEDLISYLK